MGLLKLKSKIADLDGVGKSMVTKLGVLGIKTIGDMLLHFPRTYEDMRDVQTIASVVFDEKNLVRCTIDKIVKVAIPGRKPMVKAVVSDDSGTMNVTWFGNLYITRVLQPGDSVYLHGKVKLFGGAPSMASPKHELVGAKIKDPKKGKLVPTYRETSGLSSEKIRKMLFKIFEDGVLDSIEDFLPDILMDKYDFMPLKDAIQILHSPPSMEVLAQAEERISYEELFLLRMNSMFTKSDWAESDELKTIDVSRAEIEDLISGIGFELTLAQKRVLTEIFIDLKSGKPMLRLLEGDVGSGKTILALISCYSAILSGYQSCMVAPTEILARQHIDSALELFENLDIKIAYLSSSVKGADRSKIYEDVKNGEVDLLIGTHACLQGDVDFSNLGMAVIDEQHRFGVDQRAELKKRFSPHLLTMTATPIPRTLALTAFGELSLSVLDELPPGRKIIDTRLVDEKNKMKAYKFIDAVVAEGRQIFVVCPLIEESDAMDLVNVNDHTEFLKGVFPHLEVGMMHGKLKSDEKNAIMDKFSKGETNILVSTSVIEVGVNIPNATVMVIEGAERFGLAQLHQFRGRVGRGAEKSYCLLCTSSKSSAVSERLTAMTDTHSGFDLAEIDLRMRGPGEVFGTKQSGLPDMRMASLLDANLIARVGSDLQGICEVLNHKQVSTMHKKSLKSLLSSSNSKSRN